MGFLERGNFSFYNVSRGKLRRKVEGVEEEHHGYTGYLTSLRRVSDEFEGKTIDKIEARMRDSDSDAQISIKFSERAWFAFGFFQRVVQVNFEKPFTIGVMGSKDNEKLSFCYIRQGGDIIKKTSVIPEPEKIEVNGEKTTEWTPCVEKYKEIVEEISNKLQGITVPDVPPPSAADVPPPAKAENPPISEETQQNLGLETPPPIKEDDLPF